MNLLTKHHLFILVLFLSISSCRSAYYYEYGDVSAERCRADCKLKVLAVKHAHKYDCVFYFNPYLSKHKGWLWYYTTTDNGAYLNIVHQDGRVWEEYYMPYSNTTNWIGEFNPEVNLLAFFVYDMYLDGPDFYVFLKRGNQIYAHNVNTCIDSILENPGLDTFYDQMALDILRYQPIPLNLLP